MKVYVVSIKNESGDDYGALLFNMRPTDKQLSDALMKVCPGDYDAEIAADDPDNYPGNFGYLHVKVSEQEVIEL